MQTKNVKEEYDGPDSSDRIFILLRYEFYSKYPVLKNGK